MAPRAANGNPKVTVVIAVFNMESHLAATLDSVRTQSLRDWEALIVDDSSTDQSSAIALKYCEMDSRFRYIALPVNSGRPAVPRNVGIAAARGDYVAFLDHDDLWHPAKLERQVQVLDHHPSIGMVHSHLWVNRNNRSIWGLLYLPSPHRSRANRERLRHNNVIQCSSVLVRADVLRSVGLFREDFELRTVEDYELWFRVSQHYSISFISEIHGTYRIHAMGASANERIQERLAKLDKEVGTRTQREKPPLLRRVFPRAVGFPSAAYFLLFEGKVRMFLGVTPRVWHSG